jgi:hypothetical protein
MATITSCIHNGRSLGIDEVLRLKRKSERLGKPTPIFTCSDCGQILRAHKEGTTGQQAHFEHYKRNQFCRFSY